MYRHSQEDSGLRLPPGQIHLSCQQHRTCEFVAVIAICSPHVSKQWQDTFESTHVILLFDPEHLTAANYRKKWISKQRRLAPGQSNAIADEFSFLDSILTSPLHRQSKSPTLWYHRWWLICNNPGWSPRDGLLAEIDVVLKSGERHANNYYAFQHGRRVLTSNTSDAQIGGNAAVLLLGETCLPKMMEWCLKHPSDTSGWSFLLFILNQVYPCTAAEQVVEKVAQFAINTGWQKEAMWVFLRSVLQLPKVPGDADTRTRIAAAVDQVSPPWRLALQ
jgi:hypothetical protein